MLYLYIFYDVNLHVFCLPLVLRRTDGRSTLYRQMMHTASKLTMDEWFLYALLFLFLFLL